MSGRVSSGSIWRSTAANETGRQSGDCRSVSQEFVFRRKTQGKNRSAVRLALVGHEAAMRIDDLLHDRQAEARPKWLGSGEWIEDVGAVFDPCSCIAHLDQNPAAPLVPSNLQNPALR